jgi:hypothetical protein
MCLTGFTDVVSTKDFVNQMATTLVGVKDNGYTIRGY